MRGHEAEALTWRKGAMDEWAAKEREIARRVQPRDVDRDQVYDKGVNRQRVWKKGSSGLLAAALSHFFLY
jgi:hypothetical protein